MELLARFAARWPATVPEARFTKRELSLPTDSTAFRSAGGACPCRRFKERFEAIAPSWRNFSGFCAFVPLDPVFGPNEYPANSRIGSPALGQGVAQRSFALATRGRRQYIESKFARRTRSSSPTSRQLRLRQRHPPSKARGVARRGRIALTGLPRCVGGKDRDARAPASRHLHWNRTQKVAFADVNAAIA
jgi:hypothetical protein